MKDRTRAGARTFVAVQGGVGEKIPSRKGTQSLQCEQRPLFDSAKNIACIFHDGIMFNSVNRCPINSQVSSNSNGAIIVLAVARVVKSTENGRSSTLMRPHDVSSPIRCNSFPFSFHRSHRNAFGNWSSDKAIVACSLPSLNPDRSHFIFLALLSR